MSQVFTDIASAQAGREMGQGDGGLHVEIFDEPVELTYKSKEMGYPFFEDRPFIRIMAPGDSLNVIVREITESDKQRWPRHWALYKQMGSNAGVPGFQLEEWPAISRSMAKNLKSMGFHTVEQISQASDQNISRLGMMVGMTPTTFREKALAFLKNASGNAIAESDAAEKNEMKQRISDLEAALARGGVELPKAAKRGRPAKTTE